ncbi:MAG: hypothetical protein JKX81_08420 [Arenicella sp.]|nr:hypothetical protein [Arenicella sp.]
MKNKLTTLIILVTISGCTSKQLYEGVQENSRSRCQREPNQDAREECLKGLEPDYRRYKRQRDDLLKNDEN